jgi:DNA (cytosine-5)-methyltransferase 1
MKVPRANPKKAAQAMPMAAAAAQNLALPLFAPSEDAQLENARHPYPVVSLFSGAMGLDLGLEQAGLRLAVAQDVDRWCVETMRRNGHTAIDGDIRDWLSTDPSARFLTDAAGIKASQVFAVVGGPPCQPFSTAGRRLGADDERGQLYENFVQVVKALRPRFFIMENVKGLASMPTSTEDPDSVPLLQTILSAFDAAGYKTVHGVLDAVHYGTPQFRERLVIVGSRDAEDIFLPLPSHFPFHQDPAMRWRTVADALHGLKAAGPHATLSPQAAHYLAMVPAGGNWKNLPSHVAKEAMGGAYESGGGKVGFFRRLNWHEPSPTLVTAPNQKATMLCHPTELRPLSVKEYARIQAFADDWVFEGKVADAYRQIGNAVPVPLGRALGQMLIAVATQTAQIRVKRMRGTSVHKTMSFGVSPTPTETSGDD